MTGIVELPDENVETTITILHRFKKIERNMVKMRRDLEGIKKIQWNI